MRSRFSSSALFISPFLAITIGISGCAGLGSGGSSSSGPGPVGPSPSGSGGDTGSGGSGDTGSGGSDDPGTGGSAGGGSISAGAAGTSGGGAGTMGGGGTMGSAGTSGGSPPQSGLLTAGAWDDNLNFDFYTKYLAKVGSGQLPGLPLIDRADRLEIRVTDAAGAPIGGAKVIVTGAAGKMLEAPTRSDGRLFFFPGTVGAQHGEDLQVTVALGSATAASAAKVGDPALAISLAGTTSAPPRALDLALVIDTTGSMGDEINYLKVEVSDIAARIATDFPSVAQRWALILYRDLGDAYVVRSFDFTSSLATFQAQLNAQSADGGGDYPEAPEQALAKLTTLTFNPDAVARMAFWIADAPHHPGNEGTMVNDILLAQRLGIHLYPIAASGTDNLTEYTMRTAAEVTGGRYLFLTNDSGIGGSHQEPTIPCYFVTTLSHAMIRMAAMELTGTNIEVAPADVLRTAGDPVGGRCKLANGQEVLAL